MIWREHREGERRFGEVFFAVGPSEIEMDADLGVPSREKLCLHACFWAAKNELHSVWEDKTFGSSTCGLRMKMLEPSSRSAHLMDDGLGTR